MRSGRQVLLKVGGSRAERCPRVRQRSGPSSAVGRTEARVQLVQAKGRG